MLVLAFQNILWHVLDFDIRVDTRSLDQPFAFDAPSCKLGFREVAFVQESSEAADTNPAAPSALASQRTQLEALEAFRKGRRKSW